AAVAKQFDKLWQAKETKPEDFGNLLNEKEVKVEELRAARMHVLRLLVRRAAENPEADLARAAAAVPAVEDKGAIRPAEVHFLVMLQQHRQQSEKERVPW